MTLHADQIETAIVPSQHRKAAQEQGVPGSASLKGKCPHTRCPAKSNARLSRHENDTSKIASASTRTRQTPHWSRERNLKSYIASWTRSSTRSEGTSGTTRCRSRFWKKRPESGKPSGRRSAMWVSVSLHFQHMRKESLTSGSSSMSKTLKRSGSTLSRITLGIWQMPYRASA